MIKRILLLRGTEILCLLLLASIPFAIDNAYVLGLLTLLTIYGILLIGLDVTVGYLGQVNLAQAAFLGLGAYAGALSVSLLGLDMLGALGVSMLTGLLLGALLAFPALRLEGPQFALATLSFSALSTTVLNEWESLTGGAQGLSLTRPALFGHAFNAPGFYWLCLILLALVWMAMRNLLASQWGRAFEALRDSPIATDAMGVSTFRHKVAGFAFGSSLGGLAGGLYAFNFQYLQPQSFTYDLMVILLLGVVLGGRKSLWGAFFGAALIVLLPNLLSNRLLFELISATGLLLAIIAGGRGWLKKTTPAFQALAPIIAMSLLVTGGYLVENTENWRKAIFALMLFAVVVGLPDGIMGFAARYLTRLFRIAPATLAKPSNLTDVLPLSPSDDQVLLELKNLTRYFGGVKAVDGISMSIQKGHVHGLIGPNGSGKSTAVNVISGLYAPTSGEILLLGHPLPHGSLFKVARSGVSRTFQNLQLFGELSALNNVMLALKDAYRIPLPMVMLGLAKKEDHRAQADALALLNLVGLKEQANVHARDLTYGAQRFLEIARALACKPELLILDEPAAGLAHPDAAKLVLIIKAIRQRGITTILIEHHMNIVSELCDVVTVIDGGRVIAQGTANEVKRDPMVIQAYLGVADDEPVIASS
jgi:branched-chain amino acid transport system permease protein